MTLKRFALIALAQLALFTSCSDDVEDSNQTITVAPKGDYENGILISHEGNFQAGNASISYVSTDFSTVENTIFDNVNNELLGDAAQSIAFNDNLAFIVVNGSNKVEVVNRYTFQSVATIDTGLDNPRYMAFSNGKGYVTNWGDFSNTTDDFLAIIDLGTYAVSSTISTSYLPERIISYNNSLYVATGIFGNGNLIDVVNTTTDNLDTSITVGDSPNSLQLDSSNNLWVASDTEITKISTMTNTVTSSLVLDSAAKYLSYDNGVFYYYKDSSVFSLNEDATTLPTVATVTGLSFYGMSIKDGILYGVDAGNFASNGFLRTYDLATGNSIENIELNIIPSKIYFN